MNSLRLIVSLSLLLAILAGCATSPTGTVALPRVPVWQTPADATPLQGFTVELAARTLWPGVDVFTSDTVYTRVSHAWLEQSISWTWQAQMALGFTYRPNSRDCDKFALAYFLAATSAAANAGIDATPLVARLVVEQRTTWAGVAGAVGTRHELIGVCSDRGFYVLEPQPNNQGAPRLVPLVDYPNRILAIILGDYNPPQWQ